MPMSALGQLIEDQRLRLDRSYEQIAAKATRAGYRIGKSRVHDLATGPLDDFPSTNAIRALSEGLDLPVSVVVDKALESCGLSRTTSPNSRWVTITARKQELPPRVQQSVERQVEAVLEMYDSETDN